MTFKTNECGFYFHEGIPIFLPCKALRPTMEPTQTQRQCEPKFFPGDKAAGAWTLPFRLDVVPSWRISGALSTLLKYAFIRSRWTIFLYYTAITVDCILSEIKTTLGQTPELHLSGPHLQTWFYKSKTNVAMLPHRYGLYRVSIMIQQMHFYIIKC
jgi:hypothetical protein